MPKLSLAALPRRAVVLAVAAILVVAAAAAFASLRARHMASAIATGQDDGKAPASDAGDNSGVAILLGLARQATREGRLVSPQGNNAYE
jgi:protein TonB